MFKHYLLMAWRNLFANKLHTSLNVIGLALGLAASLVIYIVNYSELTWDDFWPDVERIYQLETAFQQGDKMTFHEFTPAALVPAMRQGMVAIEQAGRVFNAPLSIATEIQPQWAGTSLNAQAQLIDEEIIELFALTAWRGNLQNFNGDPSAIVINGRLAELYFGKDDPINKTLLLDTRQLGGYSPNQSPLEGNSVQAFKVVAVLGEQPRRTTRNFELLMHIPARMRETPEWRSFMFASFVKLRAGTDPGLVASDINLLVNGSVAQDHIGLDTRASVSDYLKFTLKNIRAMHTQGVSQTGVMERIAMLYGLAVLVLAMVIVNYINLSIARYLRRQKEVALRKTLGALRRQLVAQFLIEAALSLSLALFLALMLIEPLLPWLMTTLNLNIELHYLSDPTLVGGILALVVLVALVAGGYPGLYLSSIKPALILKANKSVEAPASIRLRKYLVIGQFVISAVMLSGVGFIGLQMRHVLNYEPGYQTRNMTFFYGPTVGQLERGEMNSLKDAIAALPGVAAVAQTFPMLPGSAAQSWRVARVGQSPATAAFIDAVMIMDAKELDLLNIPLLAGRGFRGSPVVPDAPSSAQNNEIVINQLALAHFGFASAEAAVGQSLDIIFNEGARIPYAIVGVVPAVHMGDRNLPRRAQIFFYANDNSRSSTLGVRFTDDNNKALVERITDLIKSRAGGFVYAQSIEDLIADQYKNLYLAARFVFAFAFLAMVISCLGLYGLAALAAQQRTKEISLRKVHGASVLAIVRLLLWQFSLPVLLANIIAWPVALYAMIRWLEHFTQRIDLWLWGPLLCALVTLVTLLIAWLTLGGQAYWVARAKPIAALRED
jgi:putative ABC transport system permease protein